MVPDRWTVDGFGHQVGYLLLGVAVSQTDLGILTDLEKPVDINAVCPREVAQSRRTTCANDFNHRFVVLRHDEVRLVVLRPRVRMVRTWIEVNVVSVRHQVWRAGRGRSL